MVCLAITRGGWGDVLLYNNEKEARLDLIVQDGDAILPNPEALLDEYSDYEWKRLMAFAGIFDIRYEDAADYLKRTESRHLRGTTIPEIWGKLLERAVSPPVDLESIRAMVARNRMKDVRQMSEAIDEAVAAEPKEKGTGKFEPTDVVRFGKDKDGNFYGPTNIPNNPGSKRAQEFLLVRDGATVQELVNSGLAPGRLAKMVSRGDIVITAS